MAKRPSREDFALFNMELANMIRSGLPISDGLKHLSKEVRGADFQREIERIQLRMQDGQSLSTAMAGSQGIFPAEYLTLVRAGEEGGRLDEVLNHLTRYARFQARTANLIKSGMAYPVAVLCFSFILLSIILILIVPRFQELYEGAGARLPALTQLLVNLSILIRYHPIEVIGAIILLLGGFILLVQTSLKPLWDRIQLRLPVVGQISRWRLLVHYCEVVGYMLKQRIPIVDALRIASATTTNWWGMVTFDRLASEVERGGALSEGMRDTMLFPPSLTWMVAEGERQERVDEVLQDAAQLYMDHLENWSERIAAWVEPFLIFGLGSMIGIIVICLYLPLFKVGDVVR